MALTRLIQIFEGLDVPLDGNDTQALFEALESGEDVASLLSRVEGPYVSSVLPNSLIMLTIAAQVCLRVLRGQRGAIGRSSKC